MLGGEEKGMLNLLLKRDVRRALRDKNTEYTVFYAIKSGSLGYTTNNLCLAKLLRKFTDVFLDNLLKELPSKRDFVHYINIGTADNVNINIYPLSYEKLKELRK